MKKILLLLFATTLTCCSSINISDLELIQKSSKNIFTTELDTLNLPVSDLKKLTFQNERIYIYTAWKNLKQKNYAYKCEIYDGGDNLVFLFNNNFTPEKTGNWNTWTWYNISEFVDKPGLWRFKIYLSKKLIFEEKIKIEKK